MTSNERVSVDQLDAILGEKFTCLDDGFVRVVDYLGADASVVQAARISYGTGTKTIHEDRGLIRYLYRHRHSTPFEMCELKLHVRVPMDTWRQWIRHRTASVNEYSTRYSVAIDRAQKTPADGWRFQDGANKQGSFGTVSTDLGGRLSERETEFQDMSRAIYQERLDVGVAREQARKDLPLSTYTEAYWKIDLWNLLHFLSLRMDPHAQAEIRSYAAVIGSEIVAKWVPFVWEAFLDYGLNSVHFSATEIRILGHLLSGNLDGARSCAVSIGWLDRDDTGALRRDRERDEFVGKLNQQFAFSTDWLTSPTIP